MRSSSAVLAVSLYALLACARAATLEQLTIEQMSAKSTQIVRGRIMNCAGEMRGSVIYTRCRVSVTETWKGNAGALTEFIMPGGTYRDLSQTFTGGPKLTSGQEYILFLWAGRSGTNQIIGLSQGVFNLENDSKSIQAKREASSEVMLGSDGTPVNDAPVRMNVSELRSRVATAVGEAK